MVQRGQQRRFAFEPGETIGLLRELFRQRLEGDVTLERDVARLPDLAHATLAEGGQNLVMTEPGAELHGESRPDTTMHARTCGQTRELATGASAGAESLRAA